MKSVLLFLMLVLVFSSCQTSNSVVSKFGIQKRKYTKGWHISKRKNYAGLKSNKTTKATGIKLSSKKSDVIENVKLKNNLTQTTAVLPAFTEQNQIGFTTKIEKRGENVKPFETKKAKPFYLNKRSKSKSDPHINRLKISYYYEQASLLVKIEMVILGVLAIFGILALFLYLSTFSTVLYFLFSILIGIIAVISSVGGYIDLMEKGWRQFGHNYLIDVVVITGWALVFCLIILFALLIFAPALFSIPQVFLSMLYVIGLIIGVLILLIAIFVYLNWWY